MYVEILGSAAGGGFPQWNCNCGNCRSVRERNFLGKARTQTQVAVSDDGHTWFLLNASPDLPVGDRYPVYVSQRCAGSLRGSEAQVGVVITGSSGKRLAYLPAVPAISAQLLELLQGVDVVLFDPTFWSDDELLQVQGSGATAREIGHVPVFGPQGSLELLKHLKRPRKVFLHINNTNPMLNESVRNTGS